MKSERNKDDFIERKNGRRKHLKNKALDKRDNIDEDWNSPKGKKENKRKIEDLRQDELWEDWQDYE
jgi:hypothetical protein